MSLGQKQLKLKSDQVNSTIGGPSPILASSLHKSPLQVIKPLLITKPKIPKMEAIETSALTAKESSASPKSYTSQKENTVTPKTAKLGRWTPDEK